MSDPQVPANAVQEAQAVLQNPAPDEAQAPTVQVHAPAQADEVSLEVCETLFSLSFVSSFVVVLDCFVSVLVLRFCLFLSALFYFYRFAGLPCFERNVLPFLFVGFAGYFWFGILVARSRNVCPFFMWALWAVLSRMFFALLLTFCPFCGPCRL